ncbi:MAG TPA: hypothetical protein VGM93_10275, partial [Acidimicrobiales bacterium]
LFAGAGGGRGIYAVGEVVAPTTTITLDGTLPDGTVDEEVQLYAEVELLPIEPPMRVAEMEAHRVLSKGELLTDPGQDNPIVLRPEEVRALEEFEFFVIEPTDDQVARLQDVLADDGPIFQLAGIDRTFGIIDDGDPDEMLSVVTVAGEEALELGRFETFAEAIDLIRAEAVGLVLADPVDTVDGVPDGDALAALEVEDGMLCLYRTGPAAFDLWDPDDDGDLEPVARFESLDAALVGLMAAIEETDDDDAEPDTSSDA